VTEDGEQNTSALIVRGWQRAGGLAGLFAPDHGDIRPGLARPTAVYAAKPKGDKSLRHSQTVTPLARKLDQTLTLTYGTGDEAALGKELSTASGAVLVTWEHSAIPAIVPPSDPPSPPRRQPGPTTASTWSGSSPATPRDGRSAKSRNCSSTATSPTRSARPRLLRGCP
jgi:hypothetical protein